LDVVRGLAEHGEDLQGRTTEERARLRKAFLAADRQQIPLDAAKALHEQGIVSTQTYADWCRACATDQTVEEELRFHCARELARVEDLGEAEWRRIRESIPGYDDIKRWEDR
jgi:hypothetical protein